MISNQFQAGFDAAWELDIFGGIRRGAEAADADLLAAVEGSRGIFVTLAAEVAVNTIDLRAFQQRILIARRNLTAQQHSAELTRKRFLGGLVGGLDAANADAQAATTAAQIPGLEASAEQAIYRLSLLIGREPGALIPELSEACGHSGCFAVGSRGGSIAASAEAAGYSKGRSRNPCRHGPHRRGHRGSFPKGHALGFSGLSQQRIQFMDGLGEPLLVVRAFGQLAGLQHGSDPFQH